MPQPHYVRLNPFPYPGIPHGGPLGRRTRPAARRLRVPAHAPHTECRRAGGGMAGLRMSVKCLHKMDGAPSALACRRSPLSAS